MDQNNDQYQETDSYSLSHSSKNFHTKLSDTLHQLFSSDTLHQLFSDNSSLIINNHGSNSNLIKTISLFCFPKFTDLFKTMDTMFSNLISELDYPISKWDDVVIDEYLSYTLSLLHLLNSISSSLSHLSSSRLTLVHALSLIESAPSSAIKKLKPITGGGGKKSHDDGEFKEQVVVEEEERVECVGTGKVVNEAVKEMKKIGLWVCRLLLYGLTLEGGKDVAFPELEGYFGLGVSEGGVEVKEVREVNEVVVEVLDYLAKGKDQGGDNGDGEEGSAEMLKRKLEEFKIVVEEAENVVDCLFSDVLASRNQLLDCIRIK